MDTTKILGICEKINELAKQGGMSHAAIAEAVGVHHSVVSALNRVVNFDWKPVNRQASEPIVIGKAKGPNYIQARERRKKMHELRLEGLTYAKIGAKFGVSGARAMGLIHRYTWESEQAKTYDKRDPFYKLYELATRTQNTLRNNYSYRQGRDPIPMGEPGDRIIVLRFLDDFKKMHIDDFTKEMLSFPNSGRNTVGELIWFAKELTESTPANVGAAG